MKVSQIKNYYYTVSEDRNNIIHIYEKGVSHYTRSVHRYLATILKVKTGKYIVKDSDTPETSNFETLKDYIKLKSKSFEYDSGYYDPMYRKGILEQFVVIDILTDLGFESVTQDKFILEFEDIYTKRNMIVEMFLDGLPAFDNKDEIIINININDYKWISTSVKKDIKTIINKINGFIYPLLLDSTTKYFTFLEKFNMGDATESYIKKINPYTMGIENVPLKDILIEKLESTLSILKNSK